MDVGGVLKYNHLEWVQHRMVICYSSFIINISNLVKGKNLSHQFSRYSHFSHFFLELILPYIYTYNYSLLFRLFPINLFLRFIGHSMLCSGYDAGKFISDQRILIIQTISYNPI